MPSPSGPVAITSSNHLNRLLSSYTYVIADFHADWCGPCKAIAPVYESLAAEHSKPGKLVFVKIDVDANQDIARKYDVTAMPTFLVLKQDKVSKTDSIMNSLRGADPAALRRMVTDAAAAAEKSVSQSFSSAGNVLGSGSSSGSGSGSGSGASSSESAGVRNRNRNANMASSGGAGARTASGARARPGISWGDLWASVSPYLRSGGDSWYITLVRFVVLYFTTLVSLDPMASAMASPYRKNDAGRSR